MASVPDAIPRSAPRLSALSSLNRGLAALASLGVALSVGWLATMELVLRHANYQWRFLVESAIVAESALAIAVFEELIPAAPFRWPLVAGALATGLLGAWIVADDLSRSGLPAKPHFEGYLLIIGVVLIVRGAVTIAAMPGLRARA
jgi:hypothetical protein